MSETITAKMIDELCNNHYQFDHDGFDSKHPAGLWSWSHHRTCLWFHCPTFAAAARAAWAHYQASKRPAKPQCYTIDTFPKGEVWVRAKGTQCRYLVTGVEDSWIFYGGIMRKYEHIAFGHNGDTYELSTDGGITWRPARPE